MFSYKLCVVRVSHLGKSSPVTPRLAGRHSCIIVKRQITITTITLKFLRGFLNLPVVLVVALLDTLTMKKVAERRMKMPVPTKGYKVPGLGYKIRRGC